MLKHAFALILVSTISGLCADARTVLPVMSFVCPNSYTLAVMTDEAKKAESKRYEDALELCGGKNRHLSFPTKIYYLIVGFPTQKDEQPVVRCSWFLSNDRCLDLTYHADGRVKSYRFRKYVIDGVWYGSLNPELDLQDAIKEEKTRIRKLGTS
jgi:hypothetical protein